MHRTCRQWIVDILEAHLPLVSLAVRQRAKFEGWLKFELAAYAERNGASQVSVEAGSEEQTGRADITFYHGVRQYYLELKTPNTNYRSLGIEEKHRPVTKNISAVIADAKKLEACPGQGMIAFTLFPIPTQDVRWTVYLDRIATALQIPLAETTHCSRVGIPLVGGHTCEIVVCCFQYPNRGSSLLGGASIDGQNEP